MARAGKTHIHQKELLLEVESRRPPDAPYSIDHKKPESSCVASTICQSWSLGGLMPETTALNQTSSYTEIALVKL